MSQSKYPPPKGDINFPPITVRSTFYVLACLFIIGASFHESLFERCVWTFFGLMSLIAADKIKDVERAKQKERDLTEIRMKQEMLEGWENSLDTRQTFMVEQLAKAQESVLGQVSTYIRDTSPTRAAELHIVNEGEK